MTEIIRYGLKNLKTGELLGFYSMPNPEDGECINIEFILDSSYCGRIWLLENKSQAEFVRENSTEWYNADYKTPSHSYKAKDLEVVEVKLVY
jgi:hypothetical protein